MDTPLDPALVSALPANAKVTDCGDHIRIDSPTRIEWRHKLLYPAAIQAGAKAALEALKRTSPLAKLLRGD